MAAKVRNDAQHADHWANVRFGPFVTSNTEGRLDLSRFSAVPIARFSHLAFESDGAFLAQS